VKDSGFSSADYVLAEFHKYGINLRKIDDDHVSVAFNETTSIVDLDELIEIFADLKGKKTSSGFLTEKFYEEKDYNELPAELKRTTSFLQQPQFTEINSETQMMRYI
jgi:glycine dehydrogenase